jgi:glycosyltransferase involved in cell wall biosynthesis
MIADVTVVIPTIPGRERHLARALGSVYWQTVQPEQILVGAQPINLLANVRARIARNRNALLTAVRTSWVAFLDDDNYWLPQHIEVCMGASTSTDVVIYTPTVPVDFDDGNGPVQFNFRDVNLLDNFINAQREANQVDTNCMIRTSALRTISFFEENWIDHRCGRHGTCVSEDQCLMLSLAIGGANFKFVNTATWNYNVGKDGFKSSVERRTHA